MPPLLPLGSSLRGRYRIHRTLHQSRLRNLYIAEDQHLRGKFWVVKEMQPVGVDPGDRTRLLALFQAEALQISALEHPNLPKLVDFFAQEGNLYLIREFVTGSDLESVLETRRAMPETEVLKIGVQLCDLIAYLATKKLPSGTYRDMRLSNLVIGQDGQLKLLDIGFGRLFGGSGKEGIGAPDYAAPEQFTGDASNLDVRTQVYNVSALLYHLLTGVNPGASGFNLAPINEVRPGLAAATRGIVEKGVRNDPRERPPTLLDLRKGLERALSQAVRDSHRAREREAQPLSTGGGGSSVWAWVLGLLLTALMGGALVVVYQVFLQS